MGQTKQYRVLFYVQHLLGVGHVRRASLLCEALVAAGLDVHMVLGGESVAAIHFTGAQCHYLPAIRVQNADFSVLVDAFGNPLSEQARQTRRDQLLALAAHIRPDAIITEMFPFGRRQMRFELLPLLQWAQQQQPRPLLICSLRDIVQQRSADREQETLQLINRYYRRVWVHGDHQFASLEESYRLTPELGDRLHYTGYVAPSAPRIQPRRGVVVSAGGGAVGLRLLQAAIGAYHSGLLQDHPWTLIAGPNLPQPAFEQLAASLRSPHLHLVRFCSDFVSRLGAAQLSISQGGYNTVMDVLVSQVPAVIVPYVGSGETEQISRARQLQHAGRISLALESELDADSLSRAAQAALQQSRATPLQDQPIMQLNGAQAAAKDLLNLLRTPGASNPQGTP
jgi:predicted glycosyltransferase